MKKPASSHGLGGRWIAILALWLLSLGIAESARATCPGDCNGNGEVTVDELVVAVNVALGDADLASCSAADRGGDGSVSIDDLVVAVATALQGCPAVASPTPTPVQPLAIGGRCRLPGPSGGRGCDLGTEVRAYRCDDQRACLSSAASRRLLGQTNIADSEGKWAMVVDAASLASAAPVFEVNLEGAFITYRAVVGPPGPGSGGSARGRVSGLGEVVIDASSEGAVRVVEQGAPNDSRTFFEIAGGEGTRDLGDRTRAKLVFEGTDPDRAATVAEGFAAAMLNLSVQTTVFVSQSGVGYVLVGSEPGIFAHRITTLYLGFASPFVCAGVTLDGTYLHAGAAAITQGGNSLFPVEILRKSPVLAVESFNNACLSFGSKGSVCFGSLCNSDCLCSSGAEGCASYSVDQGARVEVAFAGFPPLVRTFTNFESRDGFCSFNEAATYGIGTQSPTLEIGTGDRVPADGIVLPGGSAVVLNAFDVTEGFSVGFGGFTSVAATGEIIGSFARSESR